MNPQLNPQSPIRMVAPRRSAVCARLRTAGAAARSPRSLWEVLSVHSTPRKRDAALLALKRIRALTPDGDAGRRGQLWLEDSVAPAGPHRAASWSWWTGLDDSAARRTFAKTIRGLPEPARSGRQCHCRDGRGRALSGCWLFAGVDPAGDAGRRASARRRPLGAGSEVSCI